MSTPTPITRARTAWSRFWYADVPAIRLGALQQGLAFTLLVYMLSWSRHAEEWLTPLGFHPSSAADAYNAPQVPLLSPEALPLVGLAFFGALAGFVFGIGRRLAAALVLLGVLYVTYADPISAFTLNRVYVIVFAVFVVAPRPRSSDGGEPTQIAWPLRMIQVLVPTHYFASGVCKLTQGDWAGASDVLWTQVQGFYMTDFAAWMVRTLPDWAWSGFQHASLAFELAAPLLFGLRRLRPLAFAFGIVFHIVIALSMYQLVYFSAQMLALYPAFVPPAWLARVSARLR